jgi:hypothetical protein
VFALALDPERFPATFAGCGPIPALRKITPHAPTAVGSTRSVESSDNSVLQEHVTAFEPPHRHAYVLSGMRPPLAWLAREGRADWRFTTVGDGTSVAWHYDFELTSPLAWPIAAPVLSGFMRTAMTRCLAAMAALLETREGAR